MPAPLKVLILEDQLTDAELLLRALRHEGFEPDWKRVEMEKDFSSVLGEPFDIILADYHMTQFTAIRALEILNERNINIPFIIVSGTIGEETAVEAMKKGADDYLLKDRLGRLGNAVRQALDKKRLREEKIQMTSALVEAEKKYRGIFENAQEGIYQALPDGRYITANPAMARMFGYGTPQEFIDSITESSDLLFANSEQRQDFLSRLTRNNAVTDFEARMNRKDGRKIWVSMQARIVRNKTGDVMYYEGMVQDITERKLMAEKLLRVQKMEAVGQLAGGVAHDFNNIIMIIIGVADLLREEAGNNPALLAYIDEIDQATQKASAITRQLLAFGREQIMEYKTIDLNDLLSSIGKMLQRMLGEDIDLNILPADGLGYVNADPGQIEQVILNMAINARDAMLDGGRLTIETSNVDVDDNLARSILNASPGSYVKLVIGDSGTGMTKEVMNHLFEPFFTTKKPGKGTGLGLATAFGIIRQSNGFINVYSRLGYGSTFEIYLPRASESTLQRVTAKSQTESVRGSETILVAEDEASIRKMVTKILRKSGYTVLEAVDGKSALKIINSTTDPIDLVLSDVVMPGMNGNKLFEEAIRVRPHIRFLLCSGYGDRALKQLKLLKAEILFLQKPFTPNELAAKVRQALDVNRTDTPR